jgi:hypothetical protein
MTDGQQHRYRRTNITQPLSDGNHSAVRGRFEHLRGASQVA